MAYCMSTSSAGPTTAGNLAILVPTAGTVQLISFRSYGEGVTIIDTVEAPLNHSFLNGFVTTTLTSSFTPEKSNTRSAAKVETYGLAPSDGTFGSLVFFGGLFFTHYSFIFSARYRPIIAPNTLSGGFTNDNCFSLGGLTTVNACILESDVYPAQRLARRSRKGYFPRLGNEIHPHIKTGGGAFNQICPHFDTDIVYTDISAWRLGHNQSEVWNINLYGTKKDERMKVGTGI